MEITYDNLKKIVEKIPLPLERVVIHEELDFLIGDEPQLYVEVNGREYRIKLIDYPECKDLGLPCIDGNSGSICFHYDASVKEQRSWIPHELAELEFFYLGMSREDAHRTAKKYEEKYLSENGKFI